MRLIDADKLSEQKFPLTSLSYHVGWNDAIDAIIENAPAIEAEPVKHGRWVHTDMADRWFGKDECSECTYHERNRIDLSHLNYCPNCGAKMDGGKEK